MVWQLVEAGWTTLCTVLLGYAGLRMLERRNYAQAALAGLFVCVSVVLLWFDGVVGKVAGVWCVGWFGSQALFEVATQIDARREQGR